MPTLLLVRHGRTTANASGVLAGWTPGVGLDDVGRDQAAALAARLDAAPIRLLAVSPLQRCAETADVLAAGAGAGPGAGGAGAAWAGDVRRVVVDDLGECHYGAWTGRPLAELAGEPLWRTVQEQPSLARFPASEEYRHESIAAMSARAVGAVRELDALVEAEHGADAVWALVSHGDVIKAILADAAGAHLDAFQRYVVGPASLSAVRYTPTRPYLLRVNDRGPLDDLFPAPAAPGQATDTGAAGGAGGVTASGDAVVGGATA